MNAAAAAAMLAVLSHRTIAPAAFIPAASPAPIVVPVTVVVEEGSAWAAPGKLEAVLGKASAIFGRCGVSLGAADVSVVRWSPEALKLLNTSDPYKAPPEAAALDASVPAGTPKALLFRASSIPSTAKAYNVKFVETFSRQFPETARMLNTFWITEDQESRRKPDIGPSYSVFAHELVHLLGNVGHVPDHPNLMTDDDGPGAKSGDLSPEQCAAVRKLYGLPVSAPRTP